jgi:HTH-type transcriptional regulator, transcriptional repressor of NAD biosynthesis genes
MEKKTGLVIGKFYPPHKGHNYLIDYALAHCDKLTVIVCHRDDQMIHGKLRAKWIREIHPKAKVIVVKDIKQDDNSEAWAEFTIKTLGKAPNIVFSSEDYGVTYCQHLKCQHVMVDKARTTVPISGTKIRNNPYKNWHYLHPCVQAHFAKRICVLGAESTGTTTLSRALAKHYNTNWIPEYGRFFSEGKLTNSDAAWQTDEFTHIATMQNQMEDYLARSSNKLLICDTNSLATSVWHERYMDHHSDQVETTSKNRKYDLYIITSPDIPFVQDGTRDGEHIRHKMHQQFIQKLKQKQLPFIIVSGSHEKRMKKAISHCNNLLKK